MQRPDGGYPRVETALLTDIERDPSLPNPAEQAESLILWLGDELANRIQVEIEYECDYTVVGGLGADSLRYLLDELSKKGLLRADTQARHASVLLSLDGWQKFEELSRGRVDSKRGFMAMKFGDDQLDRIYRAHFQPAAKRAGFHLETMEENPTAGSMIQRMRLEIRRSRFVVADLTHSNRGAYWEAGFAEGLRKPVIYTCEKSIFDSADKAIKPHFDVGQEQHVIWEADKLDEAAERLTLVIRNSLPDEAILEDRSEDK